MSKNNVTPFVNEHDQFKSSTTKCDLRYCVQVRDRNRVIRCVIVRLTVPRFTTPNRVKDMLNKKVVDYIKIEFPNQLGMSAVINGRVDAEF